MDKMDNWNKLNRSLYRDKEGNTIDAARLEHYLRDNDYRVVKQEVKGPYFISTVWMGVPHGVIEPFDYFETIVFLTPEWATDPRENLGKTLACYRYHNCEEAEKGHLEAVEEWENRLPTKEELDEDD